MSISCETSLLERADGSAQISVGATKILCSITGPIEAKARQELPTSAALEIIIRPAIGVSNTREKLLEDKLRAVLSSIIDRHSYPRQLIQVVIQVLQAGEENEYTVNELSGAINAAYLALIDANIALLSSFSATCLSIPHLHSGIDEFVLNPSNEQLIISASHHVVAYSISSAQTSKILLTESNGSFSEKQLYQALDFAATECENVHKKFRKAIVDKVNKDYIWKF